MAAGVVLALLAVIPPADRVANTLFAAHMAQHLVLVAVAAPLLAFGWPAGYAKPLRPAWAWLLFVAVFLFWHWPGALRWAARTPPTAALELLSIFAAAVVFWLAMIGPKASDGAGLRALYVVTASLALDLPGVVMIFAPSAICTMPEENAAAFGLSPLQDQQLAGVLMWVPANFVFFAIATVLFARWLNAAEHGAPRSI